MNSSIDYLNKLLKDGDTILLGCSGGPDSMCLLHILCDIRKKKDINIIVAHVDHNVRKESHDELVFVKNYCKDNNLLFECMTIEKYSDDNFENEARIIRYDFFEKLIAKYNVKYLFTAHHGDDLIETILMRITRGSTLAGYSGFLREVKKKNYKIIRPLIYVTKDEILEYDKNNNIKYVIDKTNLMDLHTRNRYRKVVLPFLKNEDKNVHLKFLKYSNTLKMYDDYIRKQTHKLENDVVINNVINIDKYKKLEDIFQIQIIYNLLERYYQDDLVLISDNHVLLIRNLICSRKANSYIYLPNNVRVVKSYDKIFFEKDIDQIDDYEMEISKKVVLPNKRVIEVISESKINNNFYCRLNSSDIALPLYVRTRRVGDKMNVKNMHGSKKINDIFKDMKISARDRDLWPVVLDSKGVIVWLPGLKKSKYDIPISKKCDIILKYN